MYKSGSEALKRWLSSIEIINCGDVLMQKTITIDYITHASKVNNGDEDQFFIPDHHDAIVSREVWDKAQEILRKMRWKSWKCREQLRLTPMQSGILQGYISLNPKWKQVSITRLVNATLKVMQSQSGDLIENSVTESVAKQTEESEVIMEGILKGFEVVDLTGRKGSSTMTVTTSNIKFNKATAIELGFPEYVRILINAEEKKVAIQPCTEKAKNSIAFSQDASKQNYAVVIKIPALQAAIQELLDADNNFPATKFLGNYFAEEKIIIYDLNEGEAVKGRNRKKKTDSKANEE